MEPKESLEIRKQMAEMHSSIVERIDDAYSDNRFIEVCWLCYACFENRVNRVLTKICSGCSKPKRKNKRVVGISTKLECYIRLIHSGYPPLQKENSDLINTVKGWCKERNGLIHGMVSLDCYDNVDKKFKNLAKRGKELVKRMYMLGTDVREYYYATNEIPAFAGDVVQKCRLKRKCVEE